MPIYESNKAEKLKDPNYRLKLWQDRQDLVEEEEEVPKLIAEETVYPSYTIEELRNNAGGMMDSASNVLGYFADHEKTFFSALENKEQKPSAKKIKAESPDIIEWYRKEEVQIPTIFSRAATLEGAPEDVIRDYVKARGLFEAAKIGGKGYDWLETMGDYGEAVVTDVLTLASLATIPFTGGGSVASKTAAQLLAKEAVKARIKHTLKNFVASRGNQVAAVEGGVIVGLNDYAVQTRNIAVGAQTEIDKGSVALNTVGGAIVAPLIGAGLSETFKAGFKGVKKTAKGGKKLFDYFLSPLEKKKIAQAASPENVASRDLAENGIDGDLLDREQAVTIDAERLGFNKEGSDFIEGVFDVIDDPSEVIKVVNTYARKEGLSDDAVEEMVEGILKSGSPTKGRIAQAIANTGHFIQKIPAYYGGKISTLLDPYVGKSSTMAQLQKKFRYDQQRTILGKRSAEGADYSEVLGEVFGRNFVRYKKAFDPILVATYGWQRQRAYGKLSSAVRGKLSGDEIIDEAAKKIRLQLDDTAKELQEVGLYEEAELITGNYFPRLWNRKAIKNNQVEFKNLLLKVGEAKNAEEADDIILGMMTKKFDAGDEGSFSGNSFLSKRKFDKITDDTMFEKFLDNDANNVLQSYYNSISKQIAKQKVFGATNFKGLKEVHLTNIQKELRDAGEQGLAETAEKDLYSVWSAQTGEGVTTYGNKAQFAIDTVSTATRIALLPLATLSSLTEVLLNISRGGVGGTLKNFGGALLEGGKVLTYNSLDLLMKNHNMTKPEALRKMQKFSIALDQSVADQVERLSGDNVRHWRKTNNVFFKANLLEPWTKTVQLTSFNIGRDIISNNLKALAKNQGEELTTRLSTKRDELLELGIDIDEGLKWVNRTGGNVDAEDNFMDLVDRGAARYTNEIILNPSKESGLRSKALSGNPLTTLLFQLTAYPSAFTNTVIKDIAKRTTRNLSTGDIGASAQVVGTVMALQAGGMLNNYARNEMFNDGDKTYKTDTEKVLEGAARWGGNGLYLDVLLRAKSQSERQGDIFAAGSALFGPTAGSTYKAIKTANPGAYGPQVFPLYAALSKEDKAAVRAGAYEMGTELKELLKVPKRSVYAKGGEVLDVPNTSKEPDERIDKMTGLPYNQQAGTAFTDVEDREDPLQRKAFVVGGIAKILSKTIKDFSKRVVNDAEADEAAEEILKVYKSGDPDIPSELDDEDFVAFLDLETKALLEEKHDLSMDQLRSKYPQFIGDKDELIMGEDFSRARGYTEDEIETYNIASELGDELGDSAQEATSNIQYILDSKGLTDKRPKSNVKESLSRLLAQKEAKHLALKDEEIPILEKGLGADYKEKIAALSPEDRSILESLEVPDMPTRVEKVRDVDIENRDQALKDFIKDSKEKEPVFRGTSDAFDTDYEFSFAMPRELGTHVGTKGQAASLLTRPLPMNITTFMGEVPEKTIDTAMKAGEISNKAMTKGYINVKNPLVFEEDLGSWGAEELLAPNNIQDFVSLVAKQNNQKGVTSEVIGASLKRKVIPYLDRFTEISMKGGSDTLEYSIHQAKLNKELQSFLKDFGFDSVKYKNQFEARIEGESPYSYILFEPEQFKSTFAARFDKADPRQNKADGGLLAKKDMSMYRADGSKKSNRGFIGQVKNNVDGGIMTEASIGIEIEGKEVSMPAMVPTLTAKEIEILSNMKIEGNAKNIPRSIINKAIKHAKKRRAEGKSPFYQDGEEG